MTSEKEQGITVRPQVSIYRICLDTEHGEFGPFSANFYNKSLVLQDLCDAYRYHFGMEREPAEDGIPKAHGYRSGFLPNEQQVYWLQNPFFGREGRLLNKMDDFGFVVREYKVPMEHVWIGERQVMFHPEKAVHVKDHAILDVLEEMHDELNPHQLDTKQLMDTCNVLRGRVAAPKDVITAQDRFSMNQSVRKYFKKYKNMLTASN